MPIRKLALVFAVLFASLGGAAQARSPEGFAYQVVVFPSFGPAFVDVARFSAGSVFTIDGLGTGGYITNDYLFYDTFEAHARYSAEFLVQFQGNLFLLDDLLMVANGVSEDESAYYTLVGYRIAPPTSKGPNNAWIPPPATDEEAPVAAAATTAPAASAPPPPPPRRPFWRWLFRW